LVDSQCLKWLIFMVVAKDLVPFVPFGKADSV
jgi:hypothetical protein